jgi:hypothetical protein
VLEDEGNALSISVQIAKRWCLEHPPLPRVAAITLPVIGLLAHPWFYSCGVPGLELVGIGWAMGGPLAAALIVTLDGGEMSLRARVAQWCLYVGFSLVLTFPFLLLWMFLSQPFP